MIDSPLFEAKALKVTLDGSHELEVNLALKSGEAVQLTGPSGSGKTSLLKALARLNLRISGEIILAGRESADYPPQEWRAAVCFLPQKPVMLPGTVEANLKTASSLKIGGKKPFSRHQAEELLEHLGFSRSIIEVEASRLSGGEAARVALARALMGNPRVILADEITSQQDEGNAIKMAQTLDRWRRQGNRGLIIVAHQTGVWNQVEHSSVDICGYMIGK